MIWAKRPERCGSQMDFHRRCSASPPRAGIRWATDGWRHNGSSSLGGIRQGLDVELVDLGEQFAERPRALVDQALAILGRCLPRVPRDTAGMKVLGLPGERRRAAGGKPAMVPP